MPEKIARDKSGSSKSAPKSINLILVILSFIFAGILNILVRDIKYLNKILEQDYRVIKRITKAMMGFKLFDTAEATLSGIELYHMLKKSQYKDSGKMTVLEQFYALAA